MAAAPHVFNDAGLSDEDIDHEKLQHVLFKILKIFGDPAAINPAIIGDRRFLTHDVVLSLAYEECEKFTDLLALGHDAIMGLNTPPWVEAPPAGAPAGTPAVHHPAAPLPGKWTRKIRTLVA